MNRPSIWLQIADDHSWIGGTLIDCGDAMDAALGMHGPARTRIERVSFDGDWFAVQGRDFSCGGDRSVLGIAGVETPKGVLPLIGYGGHRWFMVKPGVEWQP